MAGADLSDENSFLEILNPPVNGQVFPETLRKYSDLESFSKGDQSTTKVNYIKQLKILELAEICLLILLIFFKRN